MVFAVNSNPQSYNNFWFVCEIEKCYHDCSEYIDYEYTSKVTKKSNNIIFEDNFASN